MPAWPPLFSARAERDRELGAEVCEVSLPHSPYAVPTYYIVAPAEAAANLARYDGVRYGPRRVGPEGDIHALYQATRGEGFGAEVRRRILVGTYVLSAGYYDAYYRRRRQFARSSRRTSGGSSRPAWTSCSLRPHRRPRSRRGEDRRPVAMYLADIFVCAVSLAGLPRSACRWAQRGPAGRGPAHRAVFRGRSLLAAAAAIERAVPAEAEVRPMSWQTVIGLEVHVQLAHADQDVLRLSHRLRRPAQHQRLPGVPRAPRCPAGPERGGGAARGDGRAGAWFHHPQHQRLRPEELLLPRSAEGVPDLPVRPAAGDRRTGDVRVARSRPGAGGDNPSASGGGRRQAGARPLSRKARRWTSTGPACRWRRS